MQEGAGEGRGVRGHRRLLGLGDYQGSKATPMRTGLGKGREPLSEQEGWPMLSGFHHQLRRVRWLSR